jgi:hypothetical protein
MPAATDAPAKYNAARGQNAGDVDERVSHRVDDVLPGSVIRRDVFHGQACASSDGRAGAEAFPAVTVEWAHAGKIIAR